MDDRKVLISLRPTIPSITTTTINSTAEQFQNETLRTTLKFQNELLIEVFKAYIIKRKEVYRRLSEQKQLTYIEDSIRKDLKFKHLLLGIVIGQFTIEEWKTYHKEEKELSKRMTNLLVKRLQDQRALI